MTTTVQLSLLPAPAADADVRWLEEELRRRAGWRRAAELLQLCGKEDTEDGRRQIRTLASASAWIISGQKGYKHIEHATAEEIDHACNWLASQGRVMIDRSERLRRNAHKIFG